MCLGHVYIVLEPVGSARLTFDDDMYYELCDLMYRTLFRVLDMIMGMTRSLEKWSRHKDRLLDGYIRTPEVFRKVSGKTKVPKGLPEPPRGTNGPHWALVEREGWPGQAARHFRPALSLLH